MKIVFIIAIPILLFIVIRFLEQKSLYYPLPVIETTPRDIGLEYEGVTLTTQDGVMISGWFIPAHSPRATFLFSHGNGGNISHRLEKIKIFNDLRVNTFIYDYRGYGKSAGRPSEEGLYLDAEAVYGYLVKERKIPAQKIIGYGESLGGAVTIDLASKHELGGIIVEGSFTSIRDIAKKYFPFIPSFVYKTSFDSSAKIRRIKFPKLHFHSAGDEIIPLELGKKLFDSASEPKEFITLQGGHNDAFLISREEFGSQIDVFLDKI